MPGKNTLKSYLEGGYYHIYNRGVDKRITFTDSLDYKTFLNSLKIYLSHPPSMQTLAQNFTLKGVTFQGIPHRPKNYHQQIQLLAYCLMPNHFHLLIKQKSKDDIQHFMRSLTTKYTIYFNKRHKRTGNLFQRPYKAVLITQEPYLLHLSRYIHQNPQEFSKKPLKDYPYSSYGEYLNLRKTPWINTQEILSFFNSSKNLSKKNYLSYESFVENPQENSTDILENITLE